MTRIIVRQTFPHRGKDIEPKIQSMIAKGFKVTRFYEDALTTEIVLEKL